MGKNREALRMTEHIDTETGEITIAPTPPRPKMLPEIAKAIVAVMLKIKPLEKDAENSGGGKKYKYVSVDQFYELVGKAMAEAGIFLVAFEHSIDVRVKSSTDDRGGVRESSWLSVVFDLFLYHESGAEFGPIQRTTTVVASGPQSYAAAQSFIEKYFLRALFKIPTGDGDVDAEPKQALPAERTGVADGKTRAEAKLAFLERAKIELSVIKDIPTLEKWWDVEEPKFVKIVEGPTDPMYVKFSEEYAARGKAILSAGKDFAGRPIQKPDDVPFANGPVPTKDNPPRPSINIMRLNFRDALRETTDEDGANAAYIKWIEPYEKSLTSHEAEEFSRLLRTRLGEVSKR
jgi:hypothetical protein